MTDRDDMDDDISGQSMDRIVAPARGGFIKYGIIVVAIGLTGYLGLEQIGKSRVFEVSEDQLVFSTVTRRTFEDYIPISATSQPKFIQPVSSRVAGQVAAVYVANGARVEKDQILVVLESFDHEVDVANQKSSNTKKRGDLQDRKIIEEISLMSQETELARQEVTFNETKQELARKELLSETGDFSLAALNQLRETYGLREKQFELAKATYEAYLKQNEIKLEQFVLEEEDIDRELKIIDRLADALNIRAPIAGSVSGLILIIGENISKGTEIASVNSPDQLKFIVNLPEEVINDVSVGLPAIIEHDKKELELIVERIDPDINEGAFIAELGLVGEKPAMLRQGRTLIGRLFLTEPREALLIDNGSFIRETGGNWVFVVDEKANVARRRNVIMGKSNIRYVELLDGLHEGEKVITSSYKNYLEMEELEIHAD